jgi:hypothetical protein
LQHGVEMAARCATAAQAAGATPSNNTIQSFAAGWSLGLSPPLSDFYRYAEHQVRHRRR